MKKLILGSVLVLALSGCEKAKNVVRSDVDIVKKGTLPYEKSLTVGQAFDGYHYFSKTEWEAVKTDNGKRIVQVVGYVDLDKHPTMRRDNPPLQWANLRYQFIINTDGTFDAGWCGLDSESKTAGIKIADRNSDGDACRRCLSAIYNNEPNF